MTDGPTIKGSPMTSDIKSMQLYPRATRIYDDLRALGYADGTAVPVEVLNRFDQLHYHGTEALDAAIATCGIAGTDKVLEVGSGWGGCARYIAHTTGAQVTAVELQEDYHSVAQDLTIRAGLATQMTHINADFLALDLPDGGFAHAVSWLALFHIPDRARYLGKLRGAIAPGGMLFAEDLYLRSAPAPEAQDDFNRHLFPNSLVPEPHYRDTLVQSGFEVVEWTDMTADWTAFTAERLQAFHDNRAAYEEVHGAQGFATIDTFYTKMAGYFADGLVGGLRMAAKRG